jgi:parallel beta-helix repeat protein
MENLMLAFPETGVCRPSRLTISLLSLFLVTSTLWAQNTIRVPQDRPTIQDALNIANDGDTVVVAPGTYFENLFFWAPAITVKSAAGPDTTIIHGDGQQPAAAFQVGQGPATVLSGFTIRNGGMSGGIFVSFASPTITNNIITNNSTCGIFLRFSSAVVKNNTISNNPTPCPAPFGGAGITIDGNGSPLITGNSISNNGDLTFGDGGGIGVGSFFGIASPVVTNNTLKNNRAQLGGGIMLGFGTDAIIAQNLIIENVASLGGGVAISGASGSLTSNTIANNDVLSDASSVFLDNFISPLSLVNNLIVGRTGNTLFL